MNGRFLALAAVLAACLAGCVSQGPFPSLALRPAEQEDWTEEPVHAAPVVANDAALRTRIAALTAEAREGGRAFDADLPARRARHRSCRRRGRIGQLDRGAAGDLAARSRARQDG